MANRPQCGRSQNHSLEKSPAGRSQNHQIVRFFRGELHDLLGRAQTPSMADQFSDDTSGPLFCGNPTAQIGDWLVSRGLIYVKHGQLGIEAGADARRET
jgi:hypothetical protein